MTSTLQVTELPLYTPEYDFPRCLNSTPWVQRVSSGLVAKFSGGWEYFASNFAGNENMESHLLERLANEHQLLREAYAAGISVPKPEGIFLIPKIKEGILNHLLKRKLPTPAILMQHIEGIPLNKLRLRGKSKLFYEALDLQDEERKKARSFGFDPDDVAERNTIYSPLENKVYLVDLEYWERT